MNYETNLEYYAKYIRETFGYLVKEFGWDIFIGDEISALVQDDPNKYRIAIKHENFTFLIEDKKQLEMVIKLFSINAVPSKGLWDYDDPSKFHDEMKNVFKSIENARKLLADFNEPIECRYSYKQMTKKANKVLADLKAS